jgi:hypothetical protein
MQLTMQHSAIQQATALCHGGYQAEQSPLDMQNHGPNRIPQRTSIRRETNTALPNEKKTYQVFYEHSDNNFFDKLSRNRELSMLSNRDVE